MMERGLNMEGEPVDKNGFGFKEEADDGCINHSQSCPRPDSEDG